MTPRLHAEPVRAVYRGGWQVCGSPPPALLPPSLSTARSGQRAAAGALVHITDATSTVRADHSQRTGLKPWLWSVSGRNHRLYELWALLVLFTAV